jgi:hypothetical protein
MAELTLHFEASDGTDTAGAAAAFEQELEHVEGVEGAQTRAQHFQAIGPAEVMSVIQVGTQVIQTTTAFLTAVAALYAAWQKVKPMFPGLSEPKVEVGFEQVPISKLTDQHRAELASD